MINLVVFFIDELPLTTKAYWFEDWSKSDLFNLASAVGTAIAIVIALCGWTLRTWFTERRLTKEVGADLYLPEEISNATRFYVRPDATSIDLAQEMEEGSHVVATRENLFIAVERFLNEESPHRHMLLLADSGMGKSSFILNYYAYNQRRWFRKYKLAIIPLGYEKALEKIEQVKQPKKTILFLDALDEDSEARRSYNQRLDEIMKACSEFRRVLITCRTQFFPRDAAIPQVARLVFTPRTGQAQHTFWRLYLAPFTDKQVKKYLNLRFWFWSFKKKRKAFELAKKVPKLTVRPMLLAHIPDIIESPRAVETMWDIYETLTEKWYERELGFWSNKEDIETFSDEVAVQFYLNFIEGGSDRVSRENITNIIEDLSFTVDDLDEWKATSRSLLHRDAKGDWKFAHRSIMEFLFLKRFFIGDWRCRNITWSDQMKKFVLERDQQSKPLILSLGAAVGADLSEANLAKADLRGINLTEANLKGIVLREANLREAIFIGANLANADLTDVNLAGADLTGADLTGAKFGKADLSGAKLNKANLFRVNLSEVTVDKTDFSNANLKNADLHRRNLTQTIFHFTDLSGADLRWVDLSKTDLRTVTLQRAALNEAKLTEANLIGAKLHGADLRTANLVGADLSGADLMEANLSGAKLDRANLNKAKLYRGILSRADIREASLREAELRDARFDGANLDRADLYKANLRNATLSGASFSSSKLCYANLTNANLSGAILIEADLSGADTKGANLQGTILYGAILKDIENLSEEELLKAKIDEKTLSQLGIGKNTNEQ